MMQDNMEVNDVSFMQKRKSATKSNQDKQMKIIVLHAATTPYKYLDENDKRLYESTLDAAPLKTLPKSQIVGIALVEKYHPLVHGENEWYIKGNVGYWIEAVFRLETPIPFKGKLSLFTLPKDVQEQIKAQPGVQETLEKWSLLGKGNDDLRALSIRQPPVEAILQGMKKVENRSRSVFKV
jgi:hypothetical protein